MGKGFAGENEVRIWRIFGYNLALATFSLLLLFLLFDFCLLLLPLNDFPFAHFTRPNDCYAVVLVVCVATGKIFIHKKKVNASVGVSQRARKTIKRQEEEEEEAAAETQAAMATATAAETTLAQADKQAYQILKEWEREGEWDRARYYWSSRRCRVGKGAKSNTDKVLCLGATLLPLLLSRILLAYLFILIHHTHTNTLACDCQWVYSCVYVLFIFILFNAHQGRKSKAEEKRKYYCQIFVIFFYIKQKQSRNKKKVKKRN